MAERLSLQGIINTAVEQALRSLHVCLPAKVVKWNASKQRANCQILVKDVSEDETGARQAKSIPVVPGVPVQFLGAGGFRITCPISDGSLVIQGKQMPATTGTLFFADRSLDKWLAGSGSEVDPEIDHDHDISDAIFVPGLMPFGSPLQDVPTAAGSVGFDGGLQMLNDGSVITLAQTAGSSDFVALSKKVKAWFDAFNTAVSSWTVAPNDGGAAFRALLAAPPFSTTSTNVAATKVKAE